MKSIKGLLSIWQWGLALILVLALTGPSAAALFSDNFQNLNNWEPAITLPNLVGVPGVSFTADGADFFSTWTAQVQRKGYQTIQTFSGLSNAQAELRFKTGPSPSNIDGLMELSFFDPVTDGNLVLLQLKSGDYGSTYSIKWATRIGGVYTSGEQSVHWDYDTWYRLEIDVQANQTTLILRADDRSWIWYTTLTNFGMTQLGSNFKLGLSQYVDTPSDPSIYHSEATANSLVLNCGTPSLVSYYSFNACTAADDSGNGHGGTLYGPTCVPGKIGKAFQFDGVSNYIEVPHPGNLANGTIAGWVRFPSDPGTNWFWFCIGKEVTDSNWDYVNFGVHPNAGNTLMFGIFAGGWNWAISPVVPKAGQWYHLAGVWGSEGLKIYVNGVLQGTDSYNGGIPLETNHCYLGACTWSMRGLAQFMNGIIDEVGIYDRALTSDEIAQLARSISSVPALLPLLLD